MLPQLGDMGDMGDIGTRGDARGAKDSQRVSSRVVGPAEPVVALDIVARFRDIQRAAPCADQPDTHMDRVEDRVELSTVCGAVRPGA